MKQRPFAVVCVAWGFLLALSSAAYAQDPNVGSWRVELAKSKYNPADLAPKSVTVKSTSVGKGLNVVVDVYRRQTDNLLFDPRLPATAGEADPPIVNVGKMKNSGIDFSIGHNAPSWNISVNGSHYKNEIVSIDGVQDFFYGPITTRFGNQVINQVGHPIGAFYGYIADGFVRDAADVAAHADQAGKAPGRMKFRDVNGDGNITLEDRAIIGDPHPDFTAGLDFGVRYGNFDVSATLFGTFGNDIFENQKEFYVFREFNTIVR